MKSSRPTRASRDSRARRSAGGAAAGAGFRAGLLDVASGFPCACFSALQLDFTSVPRRVPGLRRLADRELAGSALNVLEASAEPSGACRQARTRAQRPIEDRSHRGRRPLQGRCGCAPAKCRCPTSHDGRQTPRTPARHTAKHPGKGNLSRESVGTPLHLMKTFSNCASSSDLRQPMEARGVGLEERRLRQSQMVDYQREFRMRRHDQSHDVQVARREDADRQRVPRSGCEHALVPAGPTRASCSSVRTIIRSACSPGLTASRPPDPECPASSGLALGRDAKTGGKSLSRLELVLGAIPERDQDRRFSTPAPFIITMSSSAACRCRCRRPVRCRRRRAVGSKHRDRMREAGRRQSPCHCCVEEPRVAPTSMRLPSGSRK